jgi:hypothetical protein
MDFQPNDHTLRNTALPLLNDAVRSWGSLSRNAMEYRLTALGIEERRAERKSFSRIRFQKDSAGKSYLLREQPLLPSLKIGYKEFYGSINRISFKFARHGIFLEHGVGKGRKKGSGKETPKPWIEPVMQVEIPKLADILANQTAERVSGQLRFLVPGVVDMRVDVK